VVADLDIEERFESLDEDAIAFALFALAEHLYDEILGVDLGRILVVARRIRVVTETVQNVEIEEAN